MVDLSSVQAAFSSLNTAHQLVKAFLGARDARLQSEAGRELTQVLITAQSQTLSIQSQLSAAIEEIRDLKARIVQFEDWATEKERYELKELAPGVFAYQVKEAMRGAEPVHSLCAQCYNGGVKSILQAERLDVGRVHLLVCSTCKAELLTQGLRTSPPARR